MAEEEEDIEEEEVQGPPPSKLVFVNHVDSYTGSSIAKVLKHQWDNWMKSVPIGNTEAGWLLLRNQ